VRFCAAGDAATAARMYAPEVHVLAAFAVELPWLALTVLASTPILYLMAGLNPHNHFSQPCALHSLGKWPVVDAGNGGCSMPMESTGDVLLLAAAGRLSRPVDASCATRRRAGSAAAPAEAACSSAVNHHGVQLLRWTLSCSSGSAGDVGADAGAADAAAAEGLSVSDIEFEMEKMELKFD
jgi:hypothetical protein